MCLNFHFWFEFIVGVNEIDGMEEKWEADFVDNFMAVLNRMNVESQT